MKKFGRREESETKMRSKLRHGLMSVVIFDHQEVCGKAKAFITSIANGKKLVTIYNIVPSVEQPEGVRNYVPYFSS